MDIGLRIKEARRLHGLTQKQLAEKVGVAEITIRQYEANKREPSISMLRKISDALDVSIGYIQGYEDIGAHKIYRLLKEHKYRELEEMWGLAEGSVGPALDQSEAAKALEALSAKTPETLSTKYRNRRNIIEQAEKAIDLVMRQNNDEVIRIVVDIIGIIVQLPGEKQKQIADYVKFLQAQEDTTDE